MHRAYSRSALKVVLLHNHTKNQFVYRVFDVLKRAATNKRTRSNRKFENICTGQTQSAVCTIIYLNLRMHCMHVIRRVQPNYHQQTAQLLQVSEAARNVGIHKIFAMFVGDMSAKRKTKNQSRESRFNYAFLDVGSNVHLHHYSRAGLRPTQHKCSSTLYCAALVELLFESRRNIIYLDFRLNIQSVPFRLQCFDNNNHPPNRSVEMMCK